MALFYRRLPLQGLLNARDLGGWPTKDGGVTKFRVFVRSEAPRALTEADLQFLRDYGIRTSVDFRGDRETSRQPSCLRDVGWISYHESPTFNEQVAFGTRKTGGGPPVTSFVAWGEKYVEMAEDCKGWVKKTMELLAESVGAVLYNCTTGKDRTGVVSALLLGLAGVSDEDIAADYCVSQIYLKPVYEELISEFKKHWPGEKVTLSDPFFRTDPDNILSLLSFLYRTYGSVKEYLSSCGVSGETTEMLGEKLVEYM